MPNPNGFPPVLGLDPAGALQGLQNSGANDNLQLLQLQKKRREELASNLAKAGLNRGSGFSTGGSPTDLAQLDTDITDNPAEEQDQEFKAKDRADAGARIEGFPTYAAKVAAQMVSEYHKQNMPLEVEKEKVRGAMATEQFHNNEIRKMFGMGAGEAAPGGQPPQAPVQPQGDVSSNPFTQPIKDVYRQSGRAMPGAGPAGPPTQTVPQPVQLPTSYDVTGTGPGNGFMDGLKALGQSIKTQYSATPQTPIMQDIGLSNIEEAIGMVPGARGVGNLKNLLGDIQAHYGHETPAATYAKLHGAYQQFSEAEQGINDPANLVGIDAQGRLTPKIPGQSIQNARRSLGDARKKVADAMIRLREQNPGIESNVQPRGGTKNYLSTDPNAGRR